MIEISASNLTKHSQVISRTSSLIEKPPNPD